MDSVASVGPSGSSINRTKNVYVPATEAKILFRFQNFFGLISEKRTENSTFSVPQKVSIVIESAKYQKIIATTQDFQYYCLPVRQSSGRLISQSSGKNLAPQYKEGKVFLTRYCSGRPIMILDAVCGKTARISHVQLCAKLQPELSHSQAWLTIKIKRPSCVHSQTSTTAARLVLWRTHSTMGAFVNLSKLNFRLK